MNTLTTESEIQRTSTQPAQRTVRPNADVLETPDAWILVLDVPGSDERGIDIEIERHVLSVTAEVTETEIPEGFEHIVAERPPRRYERSFRLPDTVDAAAVEATVTNGVLRIILQKPTEAKAHQVHVQAG